jgi:transposase-like protein
MSRDYDEYCPFCENSKGVSRCYGQLNGGDAYACVCRSCGATFKKQIVYTRLKPIAKDPSKETSWEIAFNDAALILCKEIDKEKEG